MDRLIRACYNPGSDSPCGPGRRRGRTTRKRAVRAFEVECGRGRAVRDFLVRACFALRTRRALTVGLVLVAAVVPAAVGASQRASAPLMLQRAAGPARALPGGASPQTKPSAGVAHSGQIPKPKSLTKPTELHLTKAGSAVFDVRSLKSVVVRRERPERKSPFDREHDGAASSAPSTLSPKGLLSSAPAPGPDSSFDGLDFATWGQGHPPDDNGDVGPNYYIQTINVSIGIYDKSSHARVAAFTFNSFMSQGNFGNLCDTDNFGDPVVVYDSFEDRWIITDSAFKLDGSGNVNPPHAFECMAVSRTGDPVTGGWNFYSVEAPGGLGDYPKFGIGSDALYMSANMFGYSASSSYTGFHTWALNKQQMYNGDPTVQVADFAGDTSDFTVIPANARLQTGTPPAGTGYFASTEQFLNALSIYTLHVN